MTGETPNPLEVLTGAVQSAIAWDASHGITASHDHERWAAALAQVEALAEAAQEVVSPTDTGYAQHYANLRAALGPFPAHQDTA